MYGMAEEGVSRGQRRHRAKSENPDLDSDGS